MVAFYSLYLSVKRMLKSSTPEGVIHTSRNLTTYDDFSNYAKGDLSSPPTRGLFSFITASMSEHELITTKIAFEEYIGLINQLSLEALNRDAFNKLRSEEVTRAFEPIFIHQLPSIFQTAIREKCPCVRGSERNRFRSPDKVTRYRTSNCIVPTSALAITHPDHRTFPTMSVH